MKIDLNDGLLSDIEVVLSPHCDERPKDMNIDMIVIHNISLPPNEFGSDNIQKFFCGELDFSKHPYFKTIEHLKVSSHLLIDRHGKITQFVPFTKRAWHAGESFFQGRTRCNDFSIGIELEGSDDLPFEKIQYEKLGEVTQLLMQSYPHITRQRIVGHSDIAPGRKTDPGKHFEWGRLFEVVTDE